MQPSPYDLYIDFAEVASLWTCGTDAPEELVYRCAFQAVEMTLGLLLDAARDERPAGRRDVRLQALADDVVAQAVLARRLLGDAPLPARLLHDGPSRSSAVQGLAGLAHREPALVARVTDALLRADWPQPLGVEAALNAARRTAGLAAVEAPVGPAVPYDAWVQPERVARLVARVEDGPESRLFVVVHQITECWLRLVLEDFALTEGFGREGRWDDASQRLEEAAAILEFLAKHIELLHLMVVADYHPLRVTLRGASGAQSAAARVATHSARQFLPPLQRHLQAEGLTVLDVFRFAHEHAEEHRYLEALGEVERRLMAFYFQHFQLARKVLGTKSLGSLGYEVRALAERFLQPLFPELDEARFDHVMLTNLAHGHEAGKLIADREGLVLATPPEPAAEVDPAVARATLERYFATINAFDLEGWVSLYHPQGSMTDPVGSRPHRGTAELRVFFTGVQRTFKRLEVTPGDIVLRGARATAPWRARGELYNGRPVAFEGTEVFDLAPDGKLVAVNVLWDPRTVAEQLLATPPASP